MDEIARRRAFVGISQGRADLTQHEQALLNHLFALSPALKTAYSLRKQLTDIFDNAPSKTSLNVNYTTGKRKSKPQA